MFDHMIAGAGLEHACKDPRCPDYVEVYRRTHRDAEFASRMLLVREVQQAALVDRTYVIADGATPENWQVARLRIQTIWWGAARLAPKVFGEKSELNLRVTDALSDRLTAALKRQRELAAAGVVLLEGVAEPAEPAALAGPDNKVTD